jgi:hypothetical protein
LPRGLGYLAYVAAILLVITYVGRLTILDPSNPLLLTTILLAGFVVNPAWYIWLGLVLGRGDVTGVSPTGKQVTVGQP